MICTTTGSNRTRAMGRDLALSLSPGTVVGLVGEMGCGKTVFVKGLAEGLGCDPRRVVSPTFTLINEYPGRINLYHFDLYRLADVSELDSIDFRKYLDAGVCAVEWFERFPDAWPADSIIVDLKYISSLKRQITIRGLKDGS